MKLSGFSTTIANIDYRRQARYQCESDFAVRFQRLPPSGFVLQASEGIASTEASPLPHQSLRCGLPGGGIPP
jgi:hypothetical protein